VSAHFTETASAVWSVNLKTASTYFARRTLVVRTDGIRFTREHSPKRRAPKYLRLKMNTHRWFFTACVDWTRKFRRFYNIDHGLVRYYTHKGTNIMATDAQPADRDTTFTYRLYIVTDSDCEMPQRLISNTTLVWFKFTNNRRRKSRINKIHSYQSLSVRL